MRSPPVMLRLSPEEAARLRELAKVWAAGQPTTGKSGRPSVTSAYVAHLLLQAERARRPGYVQHRLTSSDQAARTEIGEIARVEPTDHRRVIHPYSWARQIAGRILQSKGPRVIARHVDRWVCLDFFGAWMPPRDGMDATRVPPSKYLSAVWQLPDPTSRPFYYSVGELTSLRSTGPYNWGR